MARLSNRPSKPDDRCDRSIAVGADTILLTAATGACSLSIVIEASELAVSMSDVSQHGRSHRGLAGSRDETDGAGPEGST